MKSAGRGGLRQTLVARDIAAPESGQSPTQSAYGDLVQQAAVRSAIVSVGLIDDDGAAAFFGCSKRTFSSFMAADWMPRPINLGPRLRRWAIDELRAAVANMPRQAQQAQPDSLLRARIERAKATGSLEAPESPAPAAPPSTRRFRSGELQ